MVSLYCPVRRMKTFDGYKESLIDAKQLILTLTLLSFVNSVFVFMPQ